MDQALTEALHSVGPFALAALEGVVVLWLVVTGKLQPKSTVEALLKERDETIRELRQANTLSAQQALDALRIGESHVQAMSEVKRLATERAAREEATS